VTGVRNLIFLGHRFADTPIRLELVLKPVLMFIILHSRPLQLLLPSVVMAKQANKRQAHSVRGMVRPDGFSQVQKVTHGFLQLQFAGISASG